MNAGAGLLAHLEFATQGIGGTSSLDLEGMLNEGLLPLTPIDGQVQVIGASSVVGRHLFYNGSPLDGGDTAVDARDDNAIAAGKTPLLPGQSRSNANIDGYAAGITGIMIDIANLPAGGPTISDFEFRVGVNGDPATWLAGPAPSAIVIRRGAGQNGADRVTLTWSNGAIDRKWLQVKLLPTPRTGLAQADLFYFGSMPGDSEGDGQVNFPDLLAVSANFGRAAAPVVSGDFDADGVIGFPDLLLVSARFGAALGNFLNAPAPLPAVASPAAAQSTDRRKSTNTALLKPAPPKPPARPKPTPFSSRRIAGAPKMPAQRPLAR
jgi:hypothetical protein